MLAEELDGDIETWAYDVRDPDFLDRLAALPRLDVLVNNVGTNKPQPFTEVEDEALDLMLDLVDRTGVALLLATHSERIAARLSRRVRLSGGRLS